MTRGVVRFRSPPAAFTRWSTKCRCRGMAAPDQPVFEEALGWYVLAGKTRTWTYTIQPAQCRLVKFLEIEASAHDKQLTQRVDLAAGACVR